MFHLNLDNEDLNQNCPGETSNDHDWWSSVFNNLMCDMESNMLAVCHDAFRVMYLWENRLLFRPLKGCILKVLQLADFLKCPFSFCSRRTIWHKSKKYLLSIILSDCLKIMHYERCILSANRVFTNLKLTKSKLLLEKPRWWTQRLHSLACLKYKQVPIQ